MWHFDGHTDSFFVRSPDTTEPSPARVSWCLGLPGYCGANCWRSDVIGYNKISHTHTLINIPSHHSHTHTGSNPVFSCEMECDPLHTLHTYLLLHTSYLTFYILHDTAIILTPRYYATLRGDKVHWLPFSDIIMGHHDSGHWLRAGVMVQLMFSCSMHLFISSCIVSIIGRCGESTL